MISLLYDTLNVSASLQDPPKLFVHREEANCFLSSENDVVQ